MCERIIDREVKYKHPVLVDLSNFIRGKFTDPEDFISSGMKYLWTQEESQATKVVMIYGDYTIIIKCIYGFYGYKCDQKGISIYKDESIAKTYKDIWDRGIRNIFIDTIDVLLVIKKYSRHLFNKKSLIEKYKDEFFIDTCNMLSKISHDIVVPDNLSLKNLHDFLSECISLESYKSYNDNYVKFNEKISEKSGTYLGKYDVIIPKDIYEHHKYGVQFRNCVVSYINSVTYDNKILFIYENGKPLFCVECASNFKVNQARKICNEHLSSDEENELKRILACLK